jgi:hypothetical protein
MGPVAPIIGITYFYIPHALFITTTTTTTTTNTTIFTATTTTTKLLSFSARFTEKVWIIMNTISHDSLTGYLSQLFLITDILGKAYL